jgi:hypothetical protein
MLVSPINGPDSAERLLCYKHFVPLALREKRRHISPSSHFR